MTFGAFLIVAFITAVSTGTAIITVTGRPGHRVPEAGRAVLFPDLSNWANDIASLTVRSATGSLTMERSPQGWHLKEWDSYPADISKVRAMVAEMVRAVLLEPKTAKVERHALLDLADPDMAAGSGRKLTLKDANGNVLTAIIVGRRRFDLGSAGGGSEGVYVRRPGEAQTWLARTALFPTTDLRDWVESTVIRVSSARLSQVTLRHPDGRQTMSITQLGNGAPTIVQPIPYTAKVDESAIQRMIALLTRINFENVRNNRAVAGVPPTTQVDLATHDGLRINLTAYANSDGATWLTLTASAAHEAEGEVNTEAKTLNSRHHGWLYRIPSYIAAALHTRPESLLLKEGEQEKKETSS
ncbi:hypothetical protein RIEGSTA812A_PEG_501 [invertebrate metagenome]|uniref:DUF4340 domain-containing protein n=1 Tax=invertebrate metagenome TaxID=1711999 RepID=A0A484HA59_9ZZZZ